MDDDLTARIETISRWLTEAALPLWWNAGADRVHGGFFEALDDAGQPVSANRRARVQTRQVYVYATAGDLGWDGPWRDGVQHGLDFFLRHYRRPDGLFRTLVSPTGKAVDESAWLYDQAFALFATAQAARVLPGRSDLHDTARALIQSIQAWRLPEGGFKEPPAAYIFQSNPHMHLLEASLAWASVDDHPVWMETADHIAALTMSKFIDGNGALHEFFAPRWVFAEGIDGRIIEPGHQFEWAWLLERWARLRSHEGAHRAARRMFEIGTGWGVDKMRGVATQQLLDDGSIHDDVARLWPQTERIKAAVILGEAEEASAAIDGLKLYFDKPVAGTWWDKLRPDGTWVAENAPASSFYHIICAIAELKAAKL